MSEQPIEPEWIELETVLHLHARHLHDHGGATGIRDENLLVSALNRPRTKWSYSNPPPDLCALAAAYAFGIAKNHPFYDGNKRTSAVTCEVFLILNGLRPTASEDEKYPIYLGVAAGEVEEEFLASWLREHTAARA